MDGFFSRRENGAMAAPNTVARDMNVMAERKGQGQDINIPGKGRCMGKLREKDLKKRGGNIVLVVWQRNVNPKYL